MSKATEITELCEEALYEWMVKAHTRKSKSGKVYKVKAHERGTGSSVKASTPTHKLPDHVAAKDLSNMLGVNIPKNPKKASDEEVAHVVMGMGKAIKAHPQLKELAEKEGASAVAKKVFPPLVSKYFTEFNKRAEKD